MEREGILFGEPVKRKEFFSVGYRSNETGIPSLCVPV